MSFPRAPHLSYTLSLPLVYVKCLISGYRISRLFQFRNHDGNFRTAITLITSFISAFERGAKMVLLLRTWNAVKYHRNHAADGISAAMSRLHERDTTPETSPRCVTNEGKCLTGVTDVEAFVGAIAVNNFYCGERKTRGFHDNRRSTINLSISLKRFQKMKYDWIELK